ncbi:Serine/threonine protein kinase [Giardia duodenalis]|uniref:non-specific serine/threonine protein kinase n=1 Tax=Giardia intestinalis TaxID=5741 RepID=V6TDN4_GIAIN|nr:Serine/threonine protein kinase [Giardia intestinalis]
MLEAGCAITSPNTGKTYRLIEDIGSGTYARCWSANLEGSTEKVCIKEIFYEQYTAKEKKHAAKEVELHSTFKNNYIIKFRESFMHAPNDMGLGNGSDTMIIVMDLADSSLDQIIMHRKEKGAYFRIEEAFSLFVQIVSGVAYLHAFNLIHRDISAKNILVMLKSPRDPLSQIMMVKLADFGTCKHIDPKLVNMDHTAIGTIQTMAPEVFNEEGYDNKIDIWSLGCVLYEILTFNPLFSGGNFFAIMNKIQKYESFTDSRNIIKQYHEHEHSVVLTAILERTLSKLPNKRPSCDDILKGLLNVASFVRSPPHMFAGAAGGNTIRWGDAEKQRSGASRDRITINEKGSRDRESVLTLAMNNVGTPTRSVSEPRLPTKSLRRSDSTKSSLASITAMSELERERGRSAPRPASSLAEVGLIGAGVGMRLQKEFEERKGLRRPRSPSELFSNPESRSVSTNAREDKRDPNVRVMRKISRSLLTQFVFIDFHDGVYKIGLDSLSRHSSRGHSRIESRSSEPGQDHEYDTTDGAKQILQPPLTDVLNSGIPAPAPSVNQRSHVSRGREYKEQYATSSNNHRDRQEDTRQKRKTNPSLKKVESNSAAAKVAAILSEQRPTAASSGSQSKPAAIGSSGNSNNGQALGLAAGAGKCGDALHGGLNAEAIAREKAAHDARIRVARNTGSDVSQYQRDARRAAKLDGKSSLEADATHEQRKVTPVAHSHVSSASSFKNVPGHAEEIGKFKKTMLHQKSLKNIKEPEVQIFTGLPDETLKAMEAN